jgi:hypothetical protein
MPEPGIISVPIKKYGHSRFRGDGAFATSQLSRIVKKSRYSYGRHTGNPYGVRVGKRKMLKSFGLGRR